MYLETLGIPGTPRRAAFSGGAREERYCVVERSGIRLCFLEPLAQDRIPDKFGVWPDFGSDASSPEFPMKTHCQNMVAPLLSVLVKRPEEAFRSTEAIDRQWKDLGYLRPPNLERASAEHRGLVSVLENTGAEVRYLPPSEGTGLDSIYVRDPVLVTDAGAVILQTGKPARRGEGPAIEAAFDDWDIPILGRIEADATAEAGDMVWLDSRTLAVGHGFRTNDAGIVQLQGILEPLGVTLVPVHLPYWNGPDEVLHLMSFVSPVDSDLAVVWRRLVPVPFFGLLSRRGIQLIDVPDDEYGSMGTNVLALAPRDVVMVAGNPVTRSRLEAAGCRVTEIEGSEICLPGAGGPTCLTRPLRRG